jgi:hypothetical protein
MPTIIDPISRKALKDAITELANRHFAPLPKRIVSAKVAAKRLGISRVAMSKHLRRGPSMDRKYSKHTRRAISWTRKVLPRCSGEITGRRAAIRAAARKLDHQYVGHLISDALQKSLVNQAALG